MDHAMTVAAFIELFPSDLELLSGDDVMQRGKARQ
jgi:hypothetical protein